MGIWRISPENLSAEKLTSDTYLGDTRAAVASEFADIDPDAYLVWVDSVFISPDGNAVIYRTNRDSIVMDETSIWKIDLNTGEESQLVSPAYNNDIVGFITGSDAVIGALEDTQMVDIVNAASVPLDIPDVPNCCVNSVKDGKIIFSYRGDDSSNTTACISNVDTVTGKVFEITEVSGYLDGEPAFSPSGNKVAVGYGSDPATGINDVVIVDLSTHVIWSLAFSCSVTPAASASRGIICSNRLLAVSSISSRWVNSVPSITNVPHSTGRCSFRYRRRIRPYLPRSLSGCSGRARLGIR